MEELNEADLSHICMTVMLLFLITRRRIKRRRQMSVLSNYIFSKRKSKRLRNKFRVWKYFTSGDYFEKTVPTLSDARFIKKYRLSRKSFDELCDKIRPFIVKKDTIFRKAISVEKRVAISLHMLKSTSDAGTVADLYGVGASTVPYILKEFCRAVTENMYKDTIKLPKNRQECENMKKGYLESWNFPGVFGAIDGSHIPILAPRDDPEDYYNYKGFYSLILLALCDYKYMFTYADIGSSGRNADGGVFGNSSLFQKGESNSLFDDDLDMHIIGDSAFPIKNWLMKPFPETAGMTDAQKLFNYRLSRARMTIECAFGRLKGRWRILLKRCDFGTEDMTYIIATCCVLHNLCEMNEDTFHENWQERAAEIERDIFGPNGPPPVQVRNQGRPNISATVKRENIMKDLPDL